MRARYVAILTSMLMVGAQSASADTRSYQGDDFSIDTYSRTQMWVCDQEVDGHEVKAEFRVNGYGNSLYLYDTNGANNGCQKLGSYSTKIYQHRTIEVRNAYPDIVGAWVYPL